MQRAELTTRTILRVIACVVLCALALLLIWTLRKPIGWVLMAGFIAMALTPPVNAVHRRGVPRGLAIAGVYIVLLMIPIGLAAVAIPPIVEQGTELAENAPKYSRDVEDFIRDNKKLNELNEKYDISAELQKQADQLPGRIGDAASILGDIGLGLVSSVFAAVNILIMSIFMVANGRGWIDRLIDLRPEHERERLKRVFDHIGDAVAGYVQGALLIAFIAGLQTYVVLTILGVPFRAPLAVMAGFASLIPLVGATAAAVVIGAVTLFTDFPVATIIWAIWAVVYQQFENTVIQPQVQKRTVKVNPFIVLVAVLFGATLVGIIGALVAIPVAAAIQIALREFWEYRRDMLGMPQHEDLPGGDDTDDGPPNPNPPPEPRKATPREPPPEPEPGAA